MNLGCGPIVLFSFFVTYIELSLLVNVSSQIGLLYTFLFCIATAGLGTNLVRAEAVKTMIAAQRDLEQGQMPQQKLIEGLALLVAGVVLVMPGFLTDALGFLMLIPPVRASIARSILKNFSGAFRATGFRYVDSEFVRTYEAETETEAEADGGVNAGNAQRPEAHFDSQKKIFTTTDYEDKDV